MRFLRGRRVASGYVMAAAILLAAPVTASAKTKPITQCTGATGVEGQGASGEVVAQVIWTKEFNESKNLTACAGDTGQGSGAKPTVTYISTSSGKGLNSWGAEGSLVSDPPGNDGFGIDNAFLGDEEPPNSKQTADIEAQETSAASPSATVLSYPVGQQSVTVLVHLPAGCTGSSAYDPAPKGRLVFNNVTLEHIFDGTTTKWNEISDDGDKLSCANPSEDDDTIVRVVRPDPSGLTHIFKRYLGLINSGSFATSDGPETWDDLSEGSLNTVWPTGTVATQSSSKTGDKAEIEEVGSLESSIGYGGLSDARLVSAFVSSPGTGGPGTATFWAPIQDNGVGDTGESTKHVYPEKYADPASNGELDEKARANCEDTKYTDGEASAKFPPANVDDEWASVTSATKEKFYPICGLIYIEALGDYDAFNSPATVGEAQTVEDYTNFVLSEAAEGGQTFLNTNDYEELPAKLDKESVKDLTEIKQN